jgi:hypothetical protein
VTTIFEDARQTKTTPHVKLWNPTITPSWEKVSVGEEREKCR